MKQAVGFQVLPLVDSAGPEGGVPHGRSELRHNFCPLHSQTEMQAPNI